MKCSLFFLLFFFPSGKLCLRSPYSLASNPCFWLSPHCSCWLFNHCHLCRVQCQPCFMCSFPLYRGSDLPHLPLCHIPIGLVTSHMLVSLRPALGASGTAGRQHPRHQQGTTLPTCLTSRDVLVTRADLVAIMETRDKNDRQGSSSANY